MTHELTTERLVLRPLAAGDVDGLHALWTAAPVRRFLWDDRVVGLEETRAIADENDRLFRERRFGLWGVRERDGEDLVGVTGYWHFRTPPSLELLFAVAAPHWGRGIATEASRGALGYGFRALGFRAVVASTDVANAASIRVLEKLGMSLRGRETVDGRDIVLYEVTRDGWAGRA
jgi:[ribosomal protein S5]-alanine N-acetyltransferase